MLVVISLETMIERTKGLSIDYSALLTHSPSREQNFPLFCGQPSNEGEKQTRKRVWCVGGLFPVSFLSV